MCLETPAHSTHTYSLCRGPEALALVFVRNFGMVWSKQAYRRKRRRSYPPECMHFTRQYLNFTRIDPINVGM